MTSTPCASEPSAAMRTRVGRAYIAFVALFLTAAVALRISDPFLISSARLIAFDTYQRLSPEKFDPELPVRIVDIDDATLDKTGQWIPIALATPGVGGDSLGVIEARKSWNDGIAGTAFFKIPFDAAQMDAAEPVTTASFGSPVICP